MELLASMDACSVPNKLYQPPFYSNEEDAPEHPREYAGLVYHLKGGTGVGVLEEWVGHAQANTSTTPLGNAEICGWEYAATPPSVRQTRIWLQSNLPQNETHRKNTSQVAKYNVTYTSCLTSNLR